MMHDPAQTEPTAAVQPVAGAPADVWANPPAVLPVQPLAQPGAGSRNRALRVFLTNPAAMLGAAVLVAMTLMAIFAPVIYPVDPLDMLARPFIWPGTDPRFPLGTDALGRDVAAGIIYGSRVSLVVGVCATAVSLVLGVAVGACAGYFGGWIDDVLNGAIELFQTMPSFVLILVLVAISEPSIMVISVAIGIVSWPTIGRLVRAEFRSLRERDFVMSAKSFGYSHTRIILREILPNSLPPIIITTSIMIAAAILNESALAFLGLGDPNHISWGGMIGAGKEMIRSAWYLVFIPGVTIVLVVLALNLVGDGLNDALNPRFVRRD